MCALIDEVGPWSEVKVEIVREYAQVFLKIRIPNSLPYIFSGFKISSTLCVVGTIVGEFVASDRGLGYLLKDSQAMIDTPPMFASLILISLFGLALFGGVSALSRIAMPWQSEGPA